MNLYEKLQFTNKYKYIKKFQFINISYIFKYKHISPTSAGPSFFYVTFPYVRVIVWQCPHFCVCATYFLTKPKTRLEKQNP